MTERTGWIAGGDHAAAAGAGAGADPSPSPGPSPGAVTGPPPVVEKTAELRALPRGAARRAVVMTMGALHEGHTALIRAAREAVGSAGQVVVTVFVNPLQFGAGEDLDRYPRTLETDRQRAGEAGADVVFAPPVSEVYPDGEPRVRIASGPLGERLEGAFRPGHFDGVLTVVAKLLHLTEPDMAFYGRKDAQQLALIRRMVRDLDFPVEIVGGLTVREADGLALSSRNAYLTASERGTALALPRALHAAREAVSAGGGPGAARDAAREVLEEARGDTPPLVLDYAALVDPVDFGDIVDDSAVAGGFEGEARLVIAARVGTTRLIDNALLVLPGASR